MLESNERKLRRILHTLQTEVTGVLVELSEEAPRDEILIHDAILSMEQLVEDAYDIYCDTRDGDPYDSTDGE